MPTDTTELDFSALPRFSPRRFVPDGAILIDAVTVTNLYTKLLERPINSSKELEDWLLDRSELDAAVDQEGTLIYIRMTCQTDDESRAAAYQKFIQEIVPAVKPLADQLNRKYLAERARFALDAARYEVHDRSVRSSVDLFVAANVALQTEESLLSQEYQTICGAMTVHFEGEERTLPQMAKILLETDRVRREAAWRATAERRLKEKDRLDELFDKMLKIRTKIAANAGCANYCDYQFRAYQRFDYTPQDCRKYHETVERVVVPLWRDMLEIRRQEMDLKSLRPWDTEVDPQGRKPLAPFSEIKDLVSGTGEIFKRLDENLGSQFVGMVDAGLLDLASRRGKAPGGYQSTLTEARKPFIFMNAVGVHQDVQTLLHEGGHAFHALAASTQPLLSYRHAPMEFCEVASMGMELLGGEYLNVFYIQQEIEQARFAHFEDVVSILAWVATVDCFQQWIYENPRHTVEERQSAWLKIHGRFGGDLIDWSGIEDIHAVSWHRQLHIFEVPFYYIEYGIAQLGALQLWMNSKQDKRGALAAYKRGLALGGSRPLPELFSAAGIKFDFSEDTIAPLMEAVKSEIFAS